MAVSKDDRPGPRGDPYETMPQIELHNARKSFGSLVVIDDLSMHLDEGEALGVIGPNGAGKTTLFNLISGGLAPDAGRIAFDGGGHHGVAGP